MKNVYIISLIACLLLIGSMSHAQRSSKLQDDLDTVHSLAHLIFKHKFGYTDAQAIKQVKSFIINQQYMLEDCKLTGKMSANTLRKMKDEALAIKPDLTHKQLAKLIVFDSCDEEVKGSDSYIEYLQELLAYLESRGNS